MKQPNSKKIFQAVGLIVLIFGAMTGGIGFLLNLLLKAGDGLQIFLITSLSSIISILILFWIIFKGLKKVMGNYSSMGNMPGFPPNMGGKNFTNKFNDLNK